MVSVMSGLGPASGNSCLGRDGVDTGQKREPAPPARITAHTGESFELSGGKDFVNPGEEFFRAEWFGQEVGSAEGGGLFTIGCVTLGGKHDDRGLPMLRERSQLGQDLEARHLGHHDVEQDQIDGLPGTKTGKRGRSILIDLHGVGPVLQLELDNAADIRLIVDNDDMTAVVEHQGQCTT